MQYIEQLKQQFNWENIKKEALANPQDAFIDGEIVREGCYYLGSVLSLTPSGKFYMPWACSNVTEAEVLLDEEWWEDLEEVAAEYGMYIFSGEGDPCDIFAGCAIE